MGTRGPSFHIAVEIGEWKSGTISRMRPYTKTRSEASVELIWLRKCLGLSQAEFAVKLLDVCPMTISRMETVNPPEGEMLFKLSQIAEDETMKGGANNEELWRLAERFRVMYLEELVGKIREPLTIVSRRGRASQGFLVTPLANKDAIVVGQYATKLLKAFRSKNIAKRKAARKMIERAITEAEKL
jgi:hypothetical protein